MKYSRIKGLTDNFMKLLIMIWLTFEDNLKLTLGGVLENNVSENRINLTIVLSDGFSYIKIV